MRQFQESVNPVSAKNAGRIVVLIALK